MPGILGFPAIPTSAELTAAGIALEDHAASQAVAIIDHARQQLVLPILDAVATVPDLAKPIVASLAQALDDFVETLNGATVDNAAGVSLVGFTIPKKEKR